MDSDVEQYMRRAFDYWDGAFSHIDEDAPDGSWFQQHVDCADFHLTDGDVRAGLSDCVGLPPKNADTHDVVVAYLNELSSREQGGEQCQHEWGTRQGGFLIHCRHCGEIQPYEQGGEQDGQEPCG